MGVTKKARLGDITTFEEAVIAIRDLENALSVLTDEAASTVDDAPASVQLLVRKTDGDYEIWDLVTGGGCTITKDAGNKRFIISVP